ncbi:1-deoxy-D-xylulose-5-phosphate synthase, partial [Candidatus Woesearchaeota archaeon CG08_land_8_20_14_0_20_43_7]
MIRRISGPDDIKKMNIEELNELAGSIRCHLINTVSKTGGHLAPNLGTVELTIAMHKVFSSPRDKMVFDVGHQCYTHKLLTGRKDRFHTLRQEDGLSGFPKREESEHDAFNTGHSSTSVSASLGIAAGAKLKRDDGNVICVIGDGALTGGVALEGLNQAGYLKTNLIIILNDNEMSIASNVGGMSEYTSRIKNTDIYQNVKKEVEALIEANGTCGEHAKAIKDELKYLLNPGIVFQKLGIDYLGPIDGHNIKELICTLDEAKKRRKPVLVHIKTIKGKGYVFAEANAERFHGISSFDITNGQKNGTKKETFTSIFGKQMVKMGYNDQKTIAITAAMPSGTGLTDFAKHFPDRFFDVGIAEQHAVTFAAGLATQGFRPVVAIYSTFLQRAYDQIIHDVALQKLPVTFAIDRGGMVGEDGPTHHGVFDLSYLRHIPNMTVMVPRDEIELCDMMDFAQKHDGP